MTSMERKILIALKRYPYANIGFQELNGYLHFPPAEKIAMSIQSLQEAHYIEDQEFPNDSYSITASGIEQLKKQHLGTVMFFLPYILYGDTSCAP